MWMNIQKEIFENDELDINEKMCLIVMIGIKDIDLSIDLLARYMGCGVTTAKRSIASLREKGYFNDIEVEEVEEVEEDIYASTIGYTHSGKVIESDKAQNYETAEKRLKRPTEDFVEGFYSYQDIENEFSYDEDSTTDTISPQSNDDNSEVTDEERRARLKAYLLGEDNKESEDPEKINSNQNREVFVSKKENDAELVDRVIEMIEEKISFKEAQIILAFAGNDIELIKRKYIQAKNSQVSDAVAMLINELQKNEDNSNRSKVKQTEENTGETQINNFRIMKMQAYQKQSKDFK